MTSTDIITTQFTVPVPGRDGAGGSRLLSKLARSPTARKHKPTTSLNSSEDNSVPDQLPSLPSTAHAHRTSSRPSLGRDVTAPNGLVTLVLPPDTSLIRSHSDGKKDHATQVPGNMLDTMLKPPGPAAGKVIMPDMWQAVADVSSLPNYQYQHLQEMAAKRIATLEYMRKVHDGKRFWFNAVHFSKNDISKLPSYIPNRLARRALNYLLLGLSIPVVIDVHPQSYPNATSAASTAAALELLKNLNILLGEFETYQSLHPVDGSHVSSLSRARIPSMFKRNTTTNRPRKSSGALEFGAPSQISPPAMPDVLHHQTSDSGYSSGTFNSSTPTLVTSSPATPLSAGNYPTISSFPLPGPADAPNSTILPNEGPYNHLLTPSLPFVPDFYSVFATLCDVLIDVYQRIVQVVAMSTACTTPVMDAFSKVDARLRKVMVGAVIRDFEGQAREVAKRELMGVQKVVLGGLMGA